MQTGLKFCLAWSRNLFLIYTLTSMCDFECIWICVRACIHFCGWRLVCSLVSESVSSVVVGVLIKEGTIEGTLRHFCHTARNLQFLVCVEIDSFKKRIISFPYKIK